MKHEYSEAYITSIKLWQKLQVSGIKIKNQQSNYTMLTYDKEQIETFDIHLTGDFSYVNSVVFDGLSKRAVLMVTRIMVELKLNNPLWHFDHRINARDSAVVTELKRKEILLSTGTTEIHYINPFYIRKGKIGTIVACAIQLLEKPKKVNTDHIKRLSLKQKVSISGYDFTVI